MTKSRWTPEKDILLIKKYEEFKENIEQIHDFFPDKNERTLYRRYLKIQQMAKENGQSILEFVQSRDVHSQLERIQEILSIKDRNDRILHKIIKNSYNFSDVIAAILFLSNENNFLCIKLAFTLQYLMVEIKESILPEFYEISSKIESPLFLQHCCFFNILDY